MELTCTNDYEYDHLSSDNQTSEKRMTNKNKHFRQDRCWAACWQLQSMLADLLTHVHGSAQKANHNIH